MYARMLDKQRVFQIFAMDIKLILYLRVTGGAAAALLRDALLPFFVQKNHKGNATFNVVQL